MSPGVGAKCQTERLQPTGETIHRHFTLENIERGPIVVLSVTLMSPNGNDSSGQGTAYICSVRKLLFSTSNFILPH